MTIIVPGSDPSNSMDESKMNNSRYLVKSGDTVQMIAQNELGDASLWTDIVSLNSLVYPYISDVSSPGVLVAGDYVTLPRQLDEQESGIHKYEEPTFGTDLSLSTDKVNLTLGRGGDLSVGIDGDYDLVAGLSCLEQDLAHRLMTVRGTLPYHPLYGSDITEMVGSRRDSTSIIKAKLELERTVLCDQRVTKVTNPKVSIIPTGVSIGYEAHTQGVVLKVGGLEDEEI